MRYHVVSTLLLGLAGGCAPGAAAHRSPAPEPLPLALTLASCALPGVAAPARCGVLEVPEDRAAPDGRRIPLRVVVVPAEGPIAAPDPVFVLAGGPGQAASEMVAGLMEPLAPLRRTRDLVLVDQRGTGASNPLTCGSGSWVRDAREGAGLVATPEAVRACLAALGRRADVRFYHTPPAMEDLEAVRAALGYERIDLLGISYGSRAAQVYLRAHPERVRTMVLRAVAPMGFVIPVDGALAAQAALDALLADCAADARCGAAFPDLGREVEDLFARLEASPEAVRLRDPATGDSVDVPVTRSLLSQTVYVLLLSSATRQATPLLLHGAATRGVGALAPVLSQVLPAVYGPIPVGMYLSVICSEDEPRITAADLAREAATFTRGAEAVRAACADWPRGSLPAGYHDPVAARVPTLLVSGEADPATPPAAADRARAALGGAHLVLPATAHGPVFPGCAAELVARFVEAASAEGLDDACLRELRWSPFAVPSAGG